MKNTRKKILNYTSTDKRKLQTEKVVNKNRKIASLLIYRLESKKFLSKIKSNFKMHELLNAEILDASKVRDLKMNYMVNK